MSGHAHRWAEFREVPGIVLRQAEALSLPMAELVLQLRQRRPGVIVTCARGSSANAAGFGKHLIESHIAACLVQRFYGFLVRLAERPGTDIHAPRHLRKVTRTR